METQELNISLGKPLFHHHEGKTFEQLNQNDLRWDAAFLQGPPQILSKYLYKTTSAMVNGHSWKKLRRVIDEPLRPQVTADYLFYGSKVYAADVDDGRRDGLGRFADVMAVDEHQRRRDRRHLVVLSRLDVPERRIGQNHGHGAVRGERRVTQPLRERPGYPVAGHQARLDRGIGRMAGMPARHQPDGRKRRDVDERHAQPAGQVRRAIGQERFDDNRVEPMAAVPVPAQHVLRGRVAVDLVARVPAEPHPTVHAAEGILPLLPDVRQPVVDGGQHFPGHVHLRVVVPRPVTVRRRERRERGDRVPVVDERPQHAAHEVPVAYAAHRLHGQYVRGVRGARRRDHRRDRRPPRQSR
ncbi:hypothetical protein AGLY_012946 [Aphis glycines]|uniref:Uncharacterized protein n=1 Tax=Aphis glycines TaxID=307491 RepID=A0A6G0T9G5_APHGL|nr:hypothetical protein AGLY_012946 [Aphis glycines]